MIKFSWVIHAVLLFFRRYVLLKERNMLLTLEAEADRQEKHMPGDDRLEKVK